MCIVKLIPCRDTALPLTVADWSFLASFRPWSHQPHFHQQGSCSDLTML